MFEGVSPSILTQMHRVLHEVAMPFVSLDGLPIMHQEHPSAQANVPS